MRSTRMVVERCACYWVLLSIWVVFVGLLCGGPAEAQETQRWELVEELRMGSPDDETRAFAGVGNVGLRGQVLALSWPQEVRVFTTDGDPLAVIGQAGDGPGDFRGIGGVGWLGDSLYVTDEVLGRVTFYDERFELLGTTRFDGGRIGGPFRLAAPWRLHRGGEAIALPLIVFGLPAGDPDLGTTRRPILRTSWSGEVRDTVAILSQENSVLVVRRGGRSNSYRNQPFSDDPLVDVAADASYMVVIERDAPTQGEEAFYRVVKIDLNGDTLVTNSVGYAPVEVSEAEKEEAIGSIAERANRGEVMGSTRRLIRESIYLPEYYPPVSGVKVGSDGRIWVRRNPVEEGMVRWDLLSREGGLVGYLYLSSHLRVLESTGEIVWALWRDELDVPYVVRYRLERSRRPLRRPLAVKRPDLLAIEAEFECRGQEVDPCSST